MRQHLTHTVKCWETEVETESVRVDVPVAALTLSLATGSTCPPVSSPDRRTPIITDSSRTARRHHNSARLQPPRPCCRGLFLRTDLGMTREVSPWSIRHSEELRVQAELWSMQEGNPNRKSTEGASSEPLSLEHMLQSGFNIMIRPSLWIGCQRWFRAPRRPEQLNPLNTCRTWIIHTARICS